MLRYTSELEETKAQMCSKRSMMRDVANEMIKKIIGLRAASPLDRWSCWNMSRNTRRENKIQVGCSIEIFPKKIILMDSICRFDQRSIFKRLEKSWDIFRRHSETGIFSAVKPTKPKCPPVLTIVPNYLLPRRPDVAAASLWAAHQKAPLTQ